MKIIIFCLILGAIFSKKEFPGFLQLEAKNPDQSLNSASSANNGEYARPDQPQEHVVIPLINSLEADYNRWVAPDVRKYRKEQNKVDKDLEFKLKLNSEMEKDVQRLLNM